MADLDTARWTLAGRVATDTGCSRLTALGRVNSVLRYGPRSRWYPQVRTAYIGIMGDALAKLKPVLVAFAQAMGPFAAVLKTHIAELQEAARATEDDEGEEGTG
jgi:hypothetical protein